MKIFLIRDNIPEKKFINHYLMIMKATVLILFFCTAGLFAGEANSQVMKVTITAKARSFAKIISDIEKQTDYLFVYDKSEVDVNQKITIDAQNKPVAEVLTDILRDTDVIYAMEGENIMLMKKSTDGTETQQSDRRRISGTVIDANGEAIIGASIAVKGKSVGTTSDTNGKFTLSVSPDDKLVISYIGYMTQEIAVGDKANLDISLVENLNTLEDVVVVGYGTQKKVSLTSAISSISGDQLRSMPTSNLTNSLAGRLSGVTVSQNQGGRPGNSSNLTIRARGTWNSTNPLYVIDGVVRDSRAFDILDASEVESISVLKDASAASIYGSRAANGVILVQTRRGKEGKPMVAYSGSIGVGSFTLVPQVEGSMQHIAFTNDYEREFNVNPNTDNNIPLNEQWGFHYWPSVKKPDGSYINSNVFTDDEIEYYRNRDFNMLDEAYRTPITHNHSINISGGSDRFTYFAGVSYYNQTGAFDVVDYSKYSVRGGIDAKIAKGLKLSASINTASSTDNGPTTRRDFGSFNGGSGGEYGDEDSRRLGALFYNLIFSSHLFPGKVDGKYIGVGANMTGESALALAEGAGGSRSDRWWNTEYTAALEYEIPGIKGLTAKILYNKYVRQRYDKNYSQPYLVYQLKREGTNSHIVTDQVLSSVTKNGKPSLYEYHETRDYYQLNGFLNYNNTFGKHAVGAMLGFEIAENYGEWFNASKSDYDIVGHPYFNFGSSDKQFSSIDGKGSEDSRLSYIGRLNYGFDSRYLLEFSFRRDASVKFAKDYYWGFFPAGSAAWRISEENFFKNASISNTINNLKLRGSIGLTGNDNVGAWQHKYLLNVNTGGAYYGGSQATYGISVGKISNPLITWEKSSNWDAGLEIGFLNNLFTFSGDYFFRHTYDILGSQTAEIPDTFGATLADSNYGIVDSWGYELEVAFNKQLGKDVSVWAKGNFGYSNNKLVEWAETGVPPHLSKIGKNWDRMYGYEADGIVKNAVNNNDGTYTVTTSTGNQYIVSERGYYPNSNYDIVSSNKYALRPGVVFRKDLGSSTTDADGNKVYNNTPDGKITSDDADKTWIIDHFNPPYNFGLLLGGSYKGFSLELFFQGLAGHKSLISISNAAQYGWAQTTVGFWSADHFSFASNPTGNMPAPTNLGGFNMQGDNQHNSTDGTSFWVRDASFVRLKNVTLSYDINKRLLSKAGISLAKVYVTANNVALLYNPLGYFDPELASPTNNPDPAKDKPTPGIWSYPLMRTVTFGVNFNF
ncbi:MAG: TonB-dependent receptor [Dysgonamonadaceae bacterium]|jgi:TonB-linked SusC/RagA family outer membrane protein|nr:TonB-dependent receptor [Dysgonamonadaceae bacterium]